LPETIAAGVQVGCLIEEAVYFVGRDLRTITIRPCRSLLRIEFFLNLRVAVFTVALVVQDDIEDDVLGRRQHIRECFQPRCWEPHLPCAKPVVDKLDDAVYVIFVVVGADENVYAVTASSPHEAMREAGVEATVHECGESVSLQKNASPVPTLMAMKRSAIALLACETVQHTALPSGASDNKKPRIERCRCEPPFPTVAGDRCDRAVVYWGG
jgi:hypothetical protein